VGDRFSEDARDPARRWRNRLAKWLAGAAGAICAAGLVVYLIESHRLPPAQEKPVPKPLTVTIVPATRP
jgi:hypothetical protein